jgi:hypothetical protein
MRRLGRAVDIGLVVPAIAQIWDRAIGAAQSER